MYNIRLTHKCVILSSKMQLVNYMFRPLYWAIIKFVLSLQRTVLHNQCIEWETRSRLQWSGTWTQSIGWYQYLLFIYYVLYCSLSLISCLFTLYWMGRWLGGVVVCCRGCIVMVMVLQITHHVNVSRAICCLRCGRTYMCRRCLYGSVICGIKWYPCAGIGNNES